LIIGCDSCGTVVDLELRVKPRDPDGSIPIALRDVQCLRCKWAWQATHHCVGAASLDLRDLVCGRSQPAKWLTKLVNQYG
jgi:hypothetical protein